MNQTQLANLFLNQTNDLYWVVDRDLQLIYANENYLSLMKSVTGVEKKMNESVFVQQFGEEYIKKWKVHYQRALKGERFEIEEHYYDERLDEVQYSQINFIPHFGDDKSVIAVACQSRNITRIVKYKSEANQMIDASLDVFCSINEQGKFVYVSAASEVLWGYTPEELVGKAYAELIVEEDVLRTEKIAAAIIGGEKAKTFENRYRGKNGDIGYNLWSAKWDNKTKLMYCVARDGKEKIEQENEIRKTQKRYESFVENSLDCVVIVSPEGKTTYASGSITKILGYTVAEVLDLSIWDLCHPDDLEGAANAMAECLEQPGVPIKGFTSRIKHKNGTWRWVEPVITNLIHDPAVQGIVDNFRDVTEQIEEQRKLKLFGSVITNTNDVVIITEANPLDSPGPKIIHVNEAFTNMTGYEAGEILGQSPRFLQGPKTDKNELERLNQSLKKSEPCEITVINYKKSGEEFWVNFTVTPVINETGVTTHFIAVERDVTEQKIKELEKDLISKVSGVFNQPKDIVECLSNLAELIATDGGFDFAEIWLPAIDENTINYASGFAKGDAANDFRASLKELNTCSLGEGLPGHVWDKTSTEIWQRNEGKWLEERKVAAQKVGIEAMMGVPLKDKEEVIGVVLIAGTEKSKSDLEQYATLLQKVVPFIGAELGRKKTEIELAQIFDFTPDLICVTDFKGYIKRINTAGIEILGYSLEELLSKPINSFIYQKDQNLTEQKQSELYGGKKVQNFDNRYVTKEGKIIWLSWTATSAPEHGIVYAVAKDITEEKKLRELNRQVGELAKIGSWELDLVNQKVFWSDEVHKMHETNPNTFVPELDTAINFYREDFRQTVLTNVENCISKGEPYDFEAVIITSNKKELWVRANGKADFTDGVSTRVFGSFQNIDDRKQSENRLQSLADNLPGIVYQYLIHPDGRESMQLISGMVEQIWGLTADAVMDDVQVLWNQVRLGGDMEEVQSNIRKSIETKSRWVSRFKYVLPTGELKTHLGSGTPDFLADGTVVFNAMVFDITQETKNEELLKSITQIARIGSWELDLINQDGENMYWSPTIFEILELDEPYNPTLNGGIEFHVGESKERIRNALELLIKEGVEFDEEILLRTAKGNERWVRSIGKSEMVNDKRTKIYGSYQDIHEKKVVALELDKSLRTLKDYKYSLDQSAIIAFTDKKGVITSVNDNFCKISKYSEKEIIGNTHKLINSKYHSKSFFKDLWATIGSGKVWRGEIKNKAKDGSYYWVDTTIVPFLSEENKPFQYLAIRFDITERKIAEQERNSLQETIENSLNEIYIFDPETLHFTFVNKGALINIGYSENEIKALTPLDIKPDYTASSFEQLVRPLVNREKEKIIFFTNHQRKDGSLYPTEIHLQLVTEGTKELFLAVILDITERKKSEEEIRFKANLLSTIGQAAIATNLEGEVNYWNKAAEKIYGWATEEAIGKDIIQLTTPETSHEQAVQIMELLTKGEAWSGEFNVHKKDGTKFPAMITNSPIYNENNELMGIIGVSTDISKEVKNKELLERYTLELERSNEELEQFAFVASHDLQEPLRMITSFMDQLTRKYGDQLDEKAHQYIGFATDGAKRMKQIILDLLDYSRATKSTEGKQEVDLNEVISDFTWLRRNVIADKSATINAEDLPTLNTYKAAATQIFHCLIDNALKYAKPDVPPIIEIQVVDKKSEWQFSVKDNGIGIEPRFFDKIFVIFQRLHNNDKYTGTGIGLSIAKRHTEILGGKIWLDSSPGEGSVFYFSIPKTEADEDAQ